MPLGNLSGEAFLREEKYREKSKVKRKKAKPKIKSQKQKKQILYLQIDNA